MRCFIFALLAMLFLGAPCFPLEIKSSTGMIDSVLIKDIEAKYRSWKIKPVTGKEWRNRYFTWRNCVPVAVGIVSASISLWSKMEADRCYRIYKREIAPREIDFWYSQVEKYDKISNISLVFFELSVIWINYKLLKLNLTQ